MDTVIIKNLGQIKLIKEASHLVAKSHRIIKKEAKVGITTLELNDMVDNFIRSEGGEPAFYGYRSFPFSICASVNDEIIHGFPSKRKLKDGDLLSVDIGVRYKGFCGDAAFSLQIGSSTYRAQNLMDSTHRALIEGIQKARQGNRIGDISFAIQNFIEASGYSVVRKYCGHGIGRDVHEKPLIPNYGFCNTGMELKAGMVICIEPMALEGRRETYVDSNGWTVKTKDGKLAAHFEHVVQITDSTPYILSN